MIPKYKTLAEWRKACPREYQYAVNHKHLDEIYLATGWVKVMAKITKKECIETTLKYKTLAEWVKACPREYNYVIRHKLLDELCKGTGWFFRPRGYWTKELCIEDAKKYENIKKWQVAKLTGYALAKKNGWMEDCCAHMVINRPSSYWTLERCKEDGLKYTSKVKWQKSVGGAYKVMYKNGWMDECCGHMVVFSKPHGHWEIKENCKEDALNYKTRNNWRKGNDTAYDTARKNKWLDECCGHMEVFSKPGGYWTKELCIVEALKYKTRTEWHKIESGSYGRAHKNGWVDECCGHMVYVNKPVGYWSKELCLKDALKYNTRTEWHKTKDTSYDAARKYGWLDECTKHMIHRQGKRKVIDYQ